MKSRVSPLGLRISVVIVPIVAILGLAANIFLSAQQSRDLDVQFKERGRTLVMLLARLVSEGIAEENLDLVKRASYILETPGVAYINVYTEFWDLVETYPPRTKRPHKNEAARAYFTAHPESRFFLEDYQERGIYDRGIYDFYARVDYQPFLDSPPMAVGFVEVDISSQALLAARARMFWNHFWVGLIFCVVTIFSLLTILHLLVVRPVRRLQADMERFGQGEAPPIRPRSNDELGELTGQFNEMAATIAERNRALDEQRRYLDTLLTSSSYGIVAADADLVVRYFNPRAEELLRCPAAEVIGKGVREIHQMQGVDSSRLEKALAQVRAEGSHTFTLKPEGNGVSRTLESTISAIRNEGGRIVGSLLMINDITERLQFQRKLERSNQELAQFAYVASHDLQEPLRVITGFVQLLEQRCAPAVDAEGREYMDYIVDAAGRMKNLINDLLAYSRLTTKAKPPERVDLNDILAVAQANLQVLIAESGAEIVCEQPLPIVRAERGQMGQLFQNLLTNAIRYQRPGTAPRIQVGAQLRGREWLLSVADNGIGIEPRYFERIFKMFQRLHNREEYPGTGIGLAICKKIVERHQGRIWVEAEPGRGSTFFFTLPAGEASEEQRGKEGSAATEERRQRAADRRQGPDDRRQGPDDRRQGPDDRRQGEKNRRNNRRDCRQRRLGKTEPERE